MIANIAPPVHQAVFFFPLQLGVYHGHFSQNTGLWHVASFASGPPKGICQLAVKPGFNPNKNLMHGVDRFSPEAPVRGRIIVLSTFPIISHDPVPFTPYG